MFIFLILILDRCTDGPFLETNQHIDEYALVGLRTLAVATRHITNQEYDMFNTKLAEAAQSLEAREAKIRVSKFALHILLEFGNGLAYCLAFIQPTTSFTN